MLGQLAEPYEVIVRFTYRASRSRAMPETEKPPAMPEDIYFALKFSKILAAISFSDSEWDNGSCRKHTRCFNMLDQLTDSFHS